MLARVTPRREPISTLFAHRAISTSLSRAARPGGAATQHNSLARLIAPPSSSSSFASSSSSPFASSSSQPLPSSSSASASASSTPSSSVFDHLFPPPPTASKAGSDINTALDSLLSLSSLSPAEVELQNQLAIAAEEAEEESYALPSAWLAPTHPHTGRPRSLVGEHLRLLARESTGMKPLKPWREEEMEEQARELKSEIMRAIAISKFDREPDRGLPSSYPAFDVLEPESAAVGEISLHSTRKRRKAMMKKHRLKKRRKAQASMKARERLRTGKKG